MGNSVSMGRDMRSPAVAMSVIVAFAAIAGHAQDEKVILDTAARALGATNLTSIPYSGTGITNGVRDA